MSQSGAPAIIASFNDCITRRDLDGLSNLMTDGHVFVDAAGSVISGKARCLAVWKDFFAAFPNYKNIFNDVRPVGDTVVMIGRSSCSDSRLAGPALWTAKVAEGRIAEWRVYEDTPEDRTMLQTRTAC